MGVFMIERYLAGLTGEVLRAAGDRITATGAANYLGSVLAPGDEGSFCLFQADSQTTLERAATAEGTPFERIAAVDLVAFRPPSG